MDFLIESEKDGVIPIEVKSSDNTQSKSLKVYNELYHPKYMIRISSKDFGYNKETKKVLLQRMLNRECTEAVAEEARSRC